MRKPISAIEVKTDIINGFYISRSGKGIMDEENFTWPFDIEKLKRIVDQGFIESMVRKYYEGEITRFDWGVAFDIIFTIYGQNVFETTDLREIEIAIAMSIITRKRKDFMKASPLDIVDLVLFNNEMDPQFKQEARSIEKKAMEDVEKQVEKILEDAREKSKMENGKSESG